MIPRKGCFVKGDPRINKFGSHSPARHSYETRFRNALADGLPPEEFAKLIVEDVRNRKAGAREFYADRVMGKVKEHVEVSQPDTEIRVHVVRVEE